MPKDTRERIIHHASAEDGVPSVRVVSARFGPRGVPTSAIASGMTTLSRLLATARADAEGFALSVPADWMQGRSVFGGLQVAFALHAMRALVPDAPLRTLQTTFVAPVAGEMRVRARVLRTGKNATHVEARIGAGDGTEALVVGVFGAARGSAVARAMTPRPLEGEGTTPLALPIGASAGPAFTKHFGVRWLRGSPPYMGDTSPVHVLEVAIDDEGPATEAHLVAIADFVPPIGLAFLREPAAGSTLTWMLELLVDRVEDLPLTGYRIEAELVSARDGYLSQTVRLFGASGEAIAVSQQHMVVFG